MATGTRVRENKKDEHTLRGSTPSGWALHPPWADQPVAASQPNRRPMSGRRASLLVHHLRDCLPTDGEERSLDTVGEDACSQTTAKQPGIALFLDDLLG